ncbi:Deleted in malignant brain tumors 1 protein, partial [Chaetura pelagica]
LRLVGGPDPCAGRVEVLHNGTWGTVCDDGWGPPEGRVVCQQLGCGEVLSVAPGTRYGEGTGQIWLDEVNCTGKEKNLLECPARPWGEHNCNHLEDASVECSVTQPTFPPRPAGGPISDCAPLGPPTASNVTSLGTLQLLNGPNRCAGRVEVLHEHQWGTVCDDGWDLEDAAVVCRQLGCGVAMAAPGGAYFGRGHDPIWLDEVNCTGTEGNLFDCQAKAWGKNNCFHGEDAGVVCSAAPVGDLRRSQASSPYVSLPHVSLLFPGHLQGDHVRLVNFDNRCAGRVEIFHQGQWGTVCDDHWDLLDAQVVCRQLGCGRALAAPGKAQFGHGVGTIWMDDTNCTGMETSLSSCPARPWSHNNCYHSEDAGVVCSGDKCSFGVTHSGGSWGSDVSKFLPVRLVDGPGDCAGRVEMLFRGSWGTVCDDSWDFQDAKVVCRQLGCGVVVSAPRRAQFGQGQGRVWLYNVRCSGTEGGLSHCSSDLSGLYECEHQEDASVVC